MSFAIGRQARIGPFFNFYTTLAVVFLLAGYLWVILQLLLTSNPMNLLYLLMLIQVTPFAICFARQHYNYISFVMFNHFVTYSVAKYNQVSLLNHYSTVLPETVVALEQLIICSTLLIVTYFIFRNFFFHRFQEKERYQMLSMTRWQLIVLAAYVLLIPVFMKYIPPPMLMFHFATIAADMVLLLCADSPKNEKFAFYVRLGVFASAIYYFLGTGALTMVGNLAGYIFISSCLQRNYRRILIPILLAVVASAIQNVKYSYRSFILQNPNSSYIERIDTLGTLMSLKYLGSEDESDDKTALDDEDEESLSDELLHGFARVGDESLERVMQWTPSKVPYWGGESYAALPFLLIPRALWPDKPSRHIWNKFGKAYGYLSEDDNQTSVAVSFLAEGYMNFGLTGMYVISIIVGFFIACVERASYYFLNGYFYFSFMAFLMPLMGYANDFTSMVNSVVLMAIMLIGFRKQFIAMARKDDYM